MPKHPVFRKYTREWLSEHTGYTRGYLSKVSTGKMPLTRTFMEMVSFKLNEPKESLFLLDAASVPSSSSQNHN